MISSGASYYIKNKSLRTFFKRKLSFCSKETLYEIGNFKKGLQALGILWSTYSK